MEVTQARSDGHDRRRTDHRWYHDIVLDRLWPELCTGEVAWRFPIAFQILCALVVLCFILGLLESPSCLILKGRETEAVTVLAALSDPPKDEEYIQSEFLAIKDSVVESS